MNTLLKQVLSAFRSVSSSMINTRTLQKFDVILTVHRGLYVEIKCQLEATEVSLQILLLAQHVSGITMPIIRSSRVLYSGCCLWYFVLWFFK